VPPTSPRPRRRPFRAPTLAAAALALVLGACGSSDDASDDASAATVPATSPAAEDAADRDETSTATDDEIPDGLTLVVAEQNSSESIPWHLSGAGEGAPYDVEFANFNGGAAVIEALRAGGADVGYLGEAPIPIAVAAGVDDIVAVAISANPGSSGNYYLVANPDRGLETVQDLKGRKVAYPPGTGRHMILAAILADAGLTLGTDVEAVELAGTEVAPTFASGAVDAAMILGGQLFRLGEPPILDDGAGYNWGLNVLAVRRDTLDDPGKVAAIRDYVGRTVAAHNWQVDHVDEYVQGVYVEQQGLTAEQGRRLVDEAGFGSYYPIDDALVAVFQQIADGLHDTGAIAEPVDISPYVDDRFNDVVVARNEADGVVPKPLTQ